MSTRKYRSEAAEAIHSNIEGMYRAGAMDEATMRHFDKTCLLPPKPLAPARIKKIRKAQKVSQPVFARYMATSQSTIEKWETGAKKPTPMALKLLGIVQKHGLEILS